MDENNNYNYDYNYSDPNPKSGRTGFAITALIMGILSILLCCCGAGIIFAPLGIIFAIISLATSRGGTGMAITGLVLSSISAVFIIIVCVSYHQIIGDVIRFSGESEKVITEYQETGELPDYLDKYNGDEYKDFWKSAGYDDFNDYFDQILKSANISTSKNSSSEGGEESKNKNDDVVDLGFLPAV